MKVNCKIIKAFNRSEIYTMIPYGNYLISISQGCIKQWDLQTLQQCKKKKILSQYLISIGYMDSNFLIGFYDGRLITLNSQFKQISSLKLHQDVISDILLTEQQLITLSLDGFLKISNKKTFELNKQLNFQRPLWKMKLHKNYIYVTGNPSVKVNLQSFECEKLQNFKSFQIHKDQVYACNYYSIVNLHTNIKSYISCQLLAQFKDNLFGFKEQMIGKLISIQNNFMHWKWVKVQEFKKGYEFRFAISKDNRLLVTGDKSEIYIFQQETLNQIFE